MGIRSFISECRGLKTKMKEFFVHPYTVKCWNDCVQVDEMSRCDLLRLQSDRLASLMTHAIRHVPFYQRWALDNGHSASSPPPLAEWPIITKSVIRENFAAFRSELTPPKRMVAARTSGSSGEPFRLLADRSAQDYSYACFWRALRRRGLRPGDPRAYIWGRSFQFNSSASSILRVRLKQAVRNWLNNVLAINAYQLGNENVEAAIRQIERFQPFYLHGYASALYVIARKMLDSNKTFEGFKLRAVITDSEKLYDFQKEAMREAFGCEILEHYGSVEFGNIAQPDKSGIKRIADDCFKLETTLSGELLVTNLFSQFFPLIRFRLGDTAILSEPLPDDPLPYSVLVELTGRTVDLIPLARGGFVHGVALAHIIDPHLSMVRKYQIRQSKIDHFIVHLESGSVVDDHVFETIKTDLLTLLGDVVTIDIAQVENIAPEPSGKFRWVVSDVGHS
jgi:phenylacetate-CoA ligase